MADWDAENFEPEEPIEKAVVAAAAAVAPVKDKWEGEDEDEDVKDNWDDEEEEEKKVEIKKMETKVSDKKRLTEKIKEKENQLKKKQQQKKETEDKSEELFPEEQLAEKLRVMKLQEEADMELAKEAFGFSTVTGIDAMCPSSIEEFTEFEKLLKEKITQFEKSVHYSNFLDSLFRELCISLEVDDLKKISSSLSALLTEKQKQEKQNKGKKKKKGVVPGGGLKAQMRDELDYAQLDGGYAQDYEDFM